jgi:hypothetical protein
MYSKGIQARGHSPRPIVAYYVHNTKHITIQASQESTCIRRGPLLFYNCQWATFYFLLNYQNPSLLQDFYSLQEHSVARTSYRTMPFFLDIVNVILVS